MLSYRYQAYFYVVVASPMLMLLIFLGEVSK